MQEQWSSRQKLCLVIGVPGVILALAQVASLGKAAAAGATAGLFITIVQMKWSAWRKDARFWVVVAALFVIHVIAIIDTPIPEPEIRMAVAPFIFLDGFLVFMILNRVEKHLRRSSTAD